jgi:hypothetical protein
MRDAWRQDKRRKRLPVATIEIDNLNACVLGGLT